MWSDKVTDKDYLGFDVHASLLASLIRNEKMLPITIGLFGDWGSGKSSILESLQKELDSDKDTVCIMINSWTFEGYDDAKAALIASVLKVFDDQLKFGTTVNKKVKSLFKSIKWMRVLGWGLKNIVVPGTAAIATDGLSLGSQIFDWLKQQATDPDKLVNAIRETDSETFFTNFKEETSEDKYDYVRKFREDFADLIKETKIKKLVVLIDDLDRCLPDRIIDNLEAIKLFLNVDNTAFVIGADPRIVRHAISHRYNEISRNLDIETENKRLVLDYLEKFVQIPYYLPKLSDSEVETYITLLFCENSLSEKSFDDVLSAFIDFKKIDRYSVFGTAEVKAAITDKEDLKSFGNQINLIAHLSPLITDNLYGNPRQIKRFLNTFILRKELAKVIGMKGFKDDVLAKLMILEYAEPDLFAELYNWQVGNQGIAKELETLEKARMKGGLLEVSGNFKIWNQPKVIKWIKSKPMFSKVDLRDYFWISRDKLTSITGAQMTPPVVVSLLNELTVEGIPEKVKDKLLAEDLHDFNDGYQREFFLELKGRCLNDPSKVENYDILCAAIERGFDCMNILFDVLQINGKSTPPAALEGMKAIAEKYPKLNKLIAR